MVIAREYRISTNPPGWMDTTVKENAHTAVNAAILWEIIDDAFTLPLATRPNIFQRSGKGLESRELLT
jgi:hypothetical protein